MTGRKHVYRPNDLVRIVTPRIVTRVGYPFDQRAEADRIAKEHGNQIVALIQAIDSKSMPTFVQLAGDSQHFLRLNPAAEPGDIEQLSGLGTHKDYRDLCGRLARIIAQRHGFGGNERRLHTVEKPELTGVVCQIWHKRVVKTGDRVPASGYYDRWSGGYEYEPGYLANEQTHVLLSVSPSSYHDATQLTTFDEIEIDAVNVEPYKEPEN